MTDPISDKPSRSRKRRAAQATLFAALGALCLSASESWFSRAVSTLLPSNGSEPVQGPLSAEEEPSA